MHDFRLSLPNPIRARLNRAMLTNASLRALLLVVSSASLLSMAVHAQDAKPVDKKPPEVASCKPASGKINFNFEKATINEVLDQISRIKCMNFILSDQVKGKTDMTIVSRGPVTVPQAYAAFLSALEANGMALVPAGAFWKVVERKEASKTTVPMYELKDGSLQRVSPDETRAGELPNSDAEVTMLYEVKYANKDQVENLIRTLMSKNAELQKPPGNLLILTDSGSNILRIMEVLDKIDVSGSSNKLNVVTLQYADVAGVSGKLNEIFGTGANATPAASSKVSKKKRKAEAAAAEGKAADISVADVEGDGDIEDVQIEKIIADERTNQLLIICSAKAFERVLEVLKIIDVPAISGGSELKMWVVPLANTDAQKAAATISQLGTAGAAKKSAGAEKGGVKAKEQERAAALFEGDVKVTADETTNALVIVASGRDYQALRKVIDQLDVRRPQVYVEAAIMEVAINQNRNVGLNAYASTPVPTVGGTGIGIVANEGGRQLFQDSAKLVTGLKLLEQNANRLDGASLPAAVDATSNFGALLGFLSFQGPAVEIVPGLSLPSVGATLNLLQSNANVDILSTPHIMTTDNEKAEISVGQRVPVVRGIAPVGGAGALGIGGLQQVAYEDVKLKFSITPHVNSDGEVRIELEQEVSDLGGQVSVGNGLTQPIITNRSVKNTVVARDQQTIAIAGLISDRKSDTESKIPFFGDIPIVGWLFKTWGDTKSKTNLLIVLTPYIVRSDDDFRKIYERKMLERRQFVDAYFSDARVYNPYVDYDKKTGPLGEIDRTIHYEMDRIENGGAGHGEELIGPMHTGISTGREAKGAPGAAPAPGDEPGTDAPDDAPEPDAAEAPPPPPPDVQ